jgi:hypothetical protein
LATATTKNIRDVVQAEAAYLRMGLEGMGRSLSLLLLTESGPWSVFPALVLMLHVLVDAESREGVGRLAEQLRGT